MIKTALSLITTTSSWDDLLLTKKAFKQLKAINEGFKTGSEQKTNRNLTGTTGKVSPVLFYGSQIKEKINTTALVSNSLNAVAYRIDLLKLSSKYADETEKNLNELFDTAEKKDWILFFDEADALFEKRSDVKDAHDRYENIDVNYLLRRIEDYPGLIVLATNKKTAVDPSLLKKFKTVINFRRPKKKKP
jgi:SpoVK/Ycf46/Vps4 family AAA+-type ATPase